MMSSLEDQLLSLRSCIQNKAPYHSGTLSLPGYDFLLFYGKDDTARRIDLSSASEESIAHLAESCDIAKFGLDKQDVLDESYRKAGKLDREQFSATFDPGRTGLLDVIGTELLERDRESQSVRAEVYKLNVYGPGSFFKSHVDTPRGTDMFGSLVVVYPSRHEGGTLVLRHEGKEWTFDSWKIFAEHEEPCLAYIAFFGDVEHEVLEITSGHRVTITYNLYFTSPQPSRLPVRPFTFENDLEAAMRRLLSDPAFLPRGGKIGFCLSHLYPVDHARVVGYRELEDIYALLKGSDAVVAKVCRTLNLTWRLRVVVEDDKVELQQKVNGSYYMTAYVLFHYVPDLFGEEEADLDTSEGFFGYMRDKGGHLVTHIPRLTTGKGSVVVREEVKPDIRVNWVVPPSDSASFKTHYVAYGNEASGEYQYTHLCILANIATFDERKTDEAEETGGEEAESDGDTDGGGEESDAKASKHSDSSEQ